MQRSSIFIFNTFLYLNKNLSLILNIISSLYEIYFNKKDKIMKIKN